MAPYQSRRASLNKRTSPPSEAARWISRPEIYATHRYLFLIAKKQVKQRLQDPELIRVVALLLADIRTFRSFWGKDDRFGFLLSFHGALRQALQGFEVKAGEENLTRKAEAIDRELDLAPR